MLPLLPPKLGDTDEKKHPQESEETVASEEADTATENHPNNKNTDNSDNSIPHNKKGRGLRRTAEEWEAKQKARNTNNKVSSPPAPVAKAKANTTINSTEPTTISKTVMDRKKSVNEGNCELNENNDRVWDDSGLPTRSDSMQVGLDEPETDEWITNTPKKSKHTKSASSSAISGRRTNPDTLLDDHPTKVWLSPVAGTDLPNLDDANESSPQDDTAATSLPVPPEPTYATRQQDPLQPTTTTTEPGAFAGSPGEGLYVPSSIVGIHQSTTDDAQPTTTSFEGAIANNNRIPPSVHGLTEARPIHEDDAILPDMEAQPVDVETAQNKKLERSRKLWGYSFVLTLVFVFTIGGIILAVVLLHNQKKGSDNLGTTTSLAPSTTAPSQSPSLPPSRASFDLFLERLPEQTRKRICCKNPQYKAWEWLINHPDVPSMDESRKRQLFALATFFYSMDGENSWPKDIRDDWMQYDKHECTWFSSMFANHHHSEDGSYTEEEDAYNIAICDEEGGYQLLRLESLGLSGSKPSIPPEISLLTSLSVLALPVNNINASLPSFLPSQLYQMPNLTLLDLGTNALGGSISSEIGRMTNILELGLHHNALTGLLPSELALMTSTTKLRINNNRLTGFVSSELGMLTSLTHLDLRSNHFTGWIPSEVGKLTGIVDLVLAENAFNSSFTSEMFLLTSLTHLDIQSNRFTGRIPSEVGRLTSIEELVLAENAFNNSLLSELGLLTSLTRLDLCRNSLTGQLPSELGSMTSIVDLVLAENALNSSLPSQLGLIVNMSKLHIYGNDLFGSIPSEIGKINRMASLDLSRNNLIGVIPSGVGLLTRMVDLVLSDNALNGQIPLQLATMTNLRKLCIEHNSLTGTIPTEVASVKNMTHLALHENALTGLIPSEMGSMTGITELYLHRNNLNGSVPSQIALLTKLEHLSLEYNDLTGTVPQELEALAMNGSLITLTLSKNSFSGTIPEGLCSLGLLDAETKAGLIFACTDSLCGCCWCPCPGSEYSMECNTQSFLDERTTARSSLLTAGEQGQNIFGHEGLS